MDKTIPKPRDYGKIRDRAFSVFFHFTSSKAWVFLSMGFAYEVMYTFGIRGQQEMLKFGSVWVILVIALYVIPKFVKMQYFRDIPKGWSYSAYRAWLKIENSSFVIDGRRSMLGRIFDPYGIINYLMMKRKQRQTGYQVSKPLKVLIAVWSPLTFLMFLSIMILLKINSIDDVLMIPLVLVTSSIILRHCLNLATILEIKSEIKYGRWRLKLIPLLWYFMMAVMVAIPIIVSIVK